MTPIFDCQTGERLVAEENVRERFVIKDDYAGETTVVDSRQDVEDYLRENYEGGDLDYRLANNISIYTIEREVALEVLPIRFAWG